MADCELINRTAHGWHVIGFNARTYSKAEPHIQQLERREHLHFLPLRGVWADRMHLRRNESGSKAQTHITRRTIHTMETPLVGLTISVWIFCDFFYFLLYV
jgi:hypothetical protein